MGFWGFGILGPLLVLHSGLNRILDFRRSLQHLPLSSSLLGKCLHPGQMFKVTIHAHVGTVVGLGFK